MDTKTKELIAIGASVTANCVPCLKYHFTQATETGANEDEIRSAVAVGRMVRKGAARKWDEEADQLVERSRDHVSTGAEKSCGDS